MHGLDPMAAPIVLLTEQSAHILLSPPATDTVAIPRKIDLLTTAWYSVVKQGVFIASLV